MNFTWITEKSTLLLYSVILYSLYQTLWGSISDYIYQQIFSLQARPMTRYLPIRKEEFDLRSHVESSGHCVDTCPYVIVSEKMCKGHLVKMGGKIKSWKKRWFVFDRLKRTFSYYIGETRKSVWSLIIDPHSKAFVFVICFDCCQLLWIIFLFHWQSDRFNLSAF